MPVLKVLSFGINFEKFKHDFIFTSTILKKFVPVELLKPVAAKENKNENYSPIFTNHKGEYLLISYYKQEQILLKWTTILFLYKAFVVCKHSSYLLIV